MSVAGRKRANLAGALHLSCAVLALGLLVYRLWPARAEGEMSSTATRSLGPERVEDETRPAAMASSSRTAPKISAPSLPNATAALSFDDISDALAIEQLHDGFLDAYRATVMRNPDLARSLTRCLARVPADATKVSYRVIETFRSRGDGIAELSDVAVEADPGDPGYTDCVEAAYKEATLELPLPDSLTDAQFQVRDQAVFHIDPSLTIDDVQNILAELGTRLKDPSLPDGERPIIEQSVALYSCYLNRGIDHRRECLAE